MGDVTILGAGIFGLSVAWACLAKGAKVRVVEKRRIASGSSGGLVGALAPHTPENWNDKKQFQFESLLMAEHWWQEVARISDLDPGYARLGRLQPIADERGLELALERARKAKDLWRGSAVWDVRNGHGEWSPPSPTGRIIHDTLSARIHPRNATNALAQAIQAKGGVIEEETVFEKGGVTVDATGYEGLLDMAKRLDQPVGSGVKGQALLLDFDARDQPQLFVDGLHIIPHFDGTVAIGSTSERDWSDPTSTDTQIRDLHDRAVQAVPDLAGADIIERWAGVRPRAKSRAPMLGKDPQIEDRYIANGGFKIGFGMAPKIGNVMAELILNGRDEIPESFQVEASLR